MGDGPQDPGQGGDRIEDARQRHHHEQDPPRQRLRSCAESQHEGDHEKGDHPSADEKHAGDVAAKVDALERWDADIIGPLLGELDHLSPWRLLLLPDHATPTVLMTHTPDPVPYLLADSNDDGTGGEYTESWTAKCEPVAAHSLMGRLLRRP